MVFAPAELAIFSVSREGTLAYQTGEKITQNRLAWRDADGQELGLLGEPAEWQDPSISPDGTQVAVTLYSHANADIWIHDVERNLARRFTFDPALDYSPMWFHDGETLAFSSRRGGKFAIWSAASSGTEEPRLVVEAETTLTPLTTSPTSDELVFLDPRGDAAGLIAIAPSGGERRHLVNRETTDTGEAAVSPDGRWLAFDSGEANQSEVYVTTFPTPGRRWQISTEGGREPSWSGDGRRLFYRDSRSVLRATVVGGRGDSLIIGNTRRLFELPARFAIEKQWDVTPDGERFLIVEPVGADQLPPITLVQNWDGELPER
jgi:Tol biopolymer transport system component